MSVGLGEPNDKIHRDLLEWQSCRVCRDLIQGRMSLMSEDFVLLASGASLNIVSDPGMYVQLPVVVLCLSDCFVSTWVTSEETFVNYSYDFSLHGEVWGDG